MTIIKINDKLPIRVIMKDPLRVTYLVETLSDRNNIPSQHRYEGLIVYVQENGSNYQLQGGLDNTDWRVLLSSTDNSIVDIELLSAVGLEKTYRINFTNGTHFDYIVTDGDHPELREGVDAIEWKLSKDAERTNLVDLDKIKGKDGKDGQDGADGEDGKDGQDGADGEDGKDGQDGADGEDGKDGQDGADGEDGKDGEGVPTGGTAKQFLMKVDGTDFNTIWVDLAPVALSNDYDDLDNLPTIPTDISELTDDTNIMDGKQDKLTAGSNVDITNNTISATDTTYSAGANISIDGSNVISATDTTYSASDFDIANLSDTGGLRSSWTGKQDKLTAGSNVDITNDTISATDTTYQSSDFDIKDLTDSTSLRSSWTGKQDKLTAGNNVDITNNVVSSTNTTYQSSDFDIKDLADTTNLKSTWSGKQDSLGFTPENSANKGVASGYASLDANAKIPANQIPALAITETFVVNSQNAQLALNAEEGDIAIRTDEDKSYIHNGGDAGTMADWTQLLFPAGGGGTITSIATGTGLTGGPITTNGTISLDSTTIASLAKADTAIQSKDDKEDVVNKVVDLSSNDNVHYPTTKAVLDAISASGWGDMLAATYDPDGIAGDAFDYTNMKNKPDMSGYQTKSNLVTSLSNADDTHYPSAKAVSDAISSTGGGDMLASTYDPDNVGGDAFDYTNFKNTPTIPSKTSDLTNDSGFITSASLPTVNNGTLTIQKNSTTIDTFSANSSADKTININVPTAVSDLTNDIGFITSAALPTAVSDLTNDSGFITSASLPTKTSDLTNDSGFITNAVNDLQYYYLKTETYSKTEVDNLIADFGGFMVVATLPTSGIKTNIMYLLGPIGSGTDKYEEWIYSDSTWVKIGETTVDLTNYVTLDSAQTISGVKTFSAEPVLPTKTADAANNGTKPATEAQVYKKQDKLTAGTNIQINGSTISATDTTYESKTAAAGGTDLSLVTTGEKDTWNNKLGEILGGTNVTIGSDGKTINAVDTKYTAGTNVSISGTTISATDTKYSEISEANIKNASHTTGGLITGQRAEQLMANEATKARTISNKTLGGALVGNNQNITGLGTISLGSGTNKGTIQYSTNTTRTFTIPNPGANADFIMSQGAQTISGTKTFASLELSGDANANSKKITNLADGTNNGDAVNVSQLNSKQDTLVSGTNIKSINGQSILGSGDITITGGGAYNPVLAQVFM